MVDRGREADCGSEGKLEALRFGEPDGDVMGDKASDSSPSVALSASVAVALDKSSPWGKLGLTRGSGDPSDGVPRFDFESRRGVRRAMGFR